MYRWREGGLEAFLAHPGGPFFARKDNGHWTIPKGEVQEGEDLLETAKREFQEETGMKPVADLFIPLGSIRQKGGKIVHAWGFAGDWAADAELRSNSYEMEWPPLSGVRQRFPEVDRVAFFGFAEAHIKIKGTQRPLLDRLHQHLQAGRA